MTLAESKDTVIRAADPTLSTGRKWSAKSAVQQAKSALHHGDTMGVVQHGRTGFGFGKAASQEQSKMVVAEIHRQEESSGCAKAVSQAKQGQWMRWESIEKQTISWKDMWEMEPSRISFLIRATDDVLPSPQNLNHWLCEEDLSCPLCSTPAATLQHILTGCKVSFSQGHYTWRHNQVLKCLAATLERRRTTINALPSRRTSFPAPAAFVQKWERGQRKLQPRTRARGSPGLADAGGRRPDLVLWSMQSPQALWIFFFTNPSFFYYICNHAQSL